MNSKIPIDYYFSKNNNHAYYPMANVILCILFEVNSENKFLSQSGIEKYDIPIYYNKTRKCYSFTLVVMEEHNLYNKQLLKYLLNSNICTIINKYDSLIEAGFTYELKLTKTALLEMI